MDYIDLPPMRSAFGGVALPGSKSISNRALLLAALADGMTEIRALLSSDDTGRMLDALDALGVQIEREEGASTCRVSGVGGVFPRKEANLFLGNAGTVFRPLTAVLAFAGGRYRLSGVPRMHERPIADLVEALRRLGAQIRYLGKEGFPPLEILPPQASPGKGERLSVGVRGDVSSQFLTALLMALPLAGSDANVQVVGELISKPYIEITLNLMARFGVRVQREGWRRFTIPGGQRYRAPSALQVEGDASSASYFLAAGAIAGGPVRVAGVGRGSIQGDVRFVDELERMGARIAMGEDWVEARAPASGRLRALDADVNHIPDAAMTLAITALFADGTSTLRNIASWRVKETDRLAAMAAELAKLGAIVEHGQDYLHITPPAQWTPATIDTYDDHRMAMCASLACLGGVGVRINDPGCVAKTFPDYFEGYSSILAEDPPVIAIDGPSASGKGTVAVAVAGRFGFHYLDSGALYRLVALAAIRAGVGLEDERGVAECATELPARFDGERVFLAEEDVTQRIREEEISVAASRVAALPRVRGALLARQREFRRPPGLVADGRDMGSVVFPDAKLKVFLTASAEARARRRHKQLMEKGLSASIDSLLLELRKRDSRDSARSVAPLQVCADAVPLDTTSMTSEEAVEFVVRVAFRPKPHGERAG